MNYNELPLDQRIELAAQYALLLMADMKPKEEIIRILKNDYALTEKQAMRAFGVMKSDYKKEYHSTVNSNIYKTLGILTVSLVVFIGYFFMGREIGGGFGTGIIILSCFFGIAAIGGLIFTGTMLREKIGFTLKLPHVNFFAGPVDQFDKNVMPLAFLAFAFFCICSFRYFNHAGIIDESKITNIPGCIVTEPVRYKNTGGKNRRYYYAFKFRGHNLECRFFEDYYRYARDRSLVRTIKIWDTVSIQLLNEDLAVFEDQYSTGKINFINLSFKNRVIIDHAYRNDKVDKSNKTKFYAIMVICGSLILILILKRFYLSIRDKHREAQKS